MGTRADFYVGRGEGMEWIGSIAWDGYPDGITPNTDKRRAQWEGGPTLPVGGSWPEGEHLFDATNEATYRERVERFFRHRDDVTLPERGWPWPWDTSHTTDYAYALDNGKVWACRFGGPWFDPRDESIEDHGEVEGPPAVFPDMKSRKNVRWDAGSGIMVISAPASDG
jgi:hypothetical protein